MQRYEYKVVPAPFKGEKARGVKGTPGRFAHGLSRIMNDLARDGWEYLRADTLPCEERTGLTGKTVTYQNMLVFRREVAQALPIFDETTVPGVIPGAASALGATLAARATQAQQSPLTETDSAQTDAAPDDTAIDDTATGQGARASDDGRADTSAAMPRLSARAPEGKSPRITAFERLADTTGDDSPEPEGKISKG